MRKILFTIAVSLVSTIMMAFTVVTRMKVDPIATIEPSRPVALEVITPKIEAPVVEIIIKDHNKFLEDIGFRGILKMEKSLLVETISMQEV